MKIPAYWARARLDPSGRPDPQGVAIAFGWSDVSPEEARAAATARAQRVAAAIRDWTRGEDHDLAAAWSYYPLERPLREPVVEWLQDDAGERIGAITRNAYGCYVLNTPRAAFVDLDLPPPARLGFFARLLGRRPEPPKDDVVERVRAWVDAHPGAGLRLYRTTRGYRALLTSQGLDPTGPEASALLEGLGADPLYARLCAVQECFRARLTPKPWRIGLPAPQTAYFPWDDDPARLRRFLEWDRGYQAARAGRAVVVPVGAFGAPEVDPEVAPILALHHRWCEGAGAPV